MKRINYETAPTQEPMRTRGTVRRFRQRDTVKSAARRQDTTKPASEVSR